MLKSHMLEKTIMLDDNLRYSKNQNKLVEGLQDLNKKTKKAKVFQIITS